MKLANKLSKLHGKELRAQEEVEKRHLRLEEEALKKKEEAFEVETELEIEIEEELRIEIEEGVPKETQLELREECEDTLTNGAASHPAVICAAFHRTCTGDGPIVEHIRDHCKKTCGLC